MSFKLLNFHLKFDTVCNISVCMEFTGNIHKLNITVKPQCTNVSSYLITSFI